ncbi:MAG: Gldg family protein [Anaerolineales bacterium]|nr:Gldg family protein [Anaerolineales bacterium]
MKQALSITRKELNSYFGSPMALIFLGGFLAATLFVFFWVETFFARGIADVRPMFSWMPLLMIFLVAALTMRQWSEEQRSGTLEILLTLPVSHLQLVLGKFLAVMALVGLALALTLFLPITVSLLGNLDWGPVFGGYLATLLMAGAYTAIGLFISSRTDNQIVALISTVLLCIILYGVGSTAITDFVGETPAEILTAISAGSRFESIERGVVDLRDLVYYLSLTALFLALNIVSLDSKRWSTGEKTIKYRKNVTITMVLIGLNLMSLNGWLYPLRGLRLDLTSQKEYSLSQPTKDLLANLQEPLLIRGYFSEKTHPLLSPLVPQIQDLLREYEIASGGMVEMEIVDPAQDSEIEEEAYQTYGIEPVPFQVSDRYESSVINSYFDILIRYGDQHVVLGFQDLIEVQYSRSNQAEVTLRNLEYDLTRSIKKVIYGFQSVDAVLASMSQPVKLSIFISPDTLPEWLAEAPATLEKVAADIQAGSDKFTFQIYNPDDPSSPINRDQLYTQYGLQPIAVSLFSPDTYYFYMVLEVEGEAQIVYPTGDLSEADFKTAIESALKRSSTGFLKVVGLWTPPYQPTTDMYGQTQEPLSSYTIVGDYLGEDYEVRSIGLTAEVAADVDVLVVVAPQNLTNREQFNIDQYLMRGGAVILAAGNYAIALDPYMGSLILNPVEGGLREMLASYGVQIDESLVMDSQNEPFPMAVPRTVGDYQIQEIQALDYPFFIDIRQDGMDSQNPIVSNLTAVTLNWASPITLGEEKNANRQVSVFLNSSEQSWLQTDTTIEPNFELYPELGFSIGEAMQSYPIAVLLQGSFESYFIGKEIPELEIEGETTEETESRPASGVIEESPDSARLIVFSSGEFLNDTVMQLSTNLSGDRYLNSLQMIQNAVDWSVEDTELLAIRSRGTTSRVLSQTAEEDESFWEWLNYGLALASLIVIGVVWNVRRRNEQPIDLGIETPDADRKEIEDGIPSQEES